MLSCAEQMLVRLSEVDPVGAAGLRTRVNGRLQLAGSLIPLCRADSEPHHEPCHFGFLLKSRAFGRFSIISPSSKTRESRGGWPHWLDGRPPVPRLKSACPTSPRREGRLPRRTQGQMPLRDTLLRLIRRALRLPRGRGRSRPLGHREQSCIGFSMSPSAMINRASEPGTAPKNMAVVRPSP